MSTEVRDAARVFLGKGYQPTPIKAGSKQPLLKDWPNHKMCAADLDLLSTRCSELGATSQRLGFASMADAAGATASAGSDGKADLAEDGVVEITQLGQRIRLGHRGAA